MKRRFLRNGERERMREIIKDLQAQQTTLCCGYSAAMDQADCCRCVYALTCHEHQGSPGCHEYFLKRSHEKFESDKDIAETFKRLGFETEDQLNAFREKFGILPAGHDWEEQVRILKETIVGD